MMTLKSRQSKTWVVCASMAGTAGMAKLRLVADVIKTDLRVVNRRRGRQVFKVGSQWQAW